MNYLVHGRIVTPYGVLTGRALCTDHEKISAIIPEGDVPPGAATTDLENGLLVPGFIDIQINGGGGRQFNDAPDVETLRTMSKALLATGCTGFLPTLVSAPYDTIARAIAATNDAMAEGVPGLLGVHIEGPFISTKKRGIHDARLCRPLDAEGMKLLTSLAHGKLIVTLAPEQATAGQITALTDAGVIVSLGHSNADYETATTALKAGARGFTHLYNAMSAMETRAPNMVGAALSAKNAWCGIVIDGHHVHPAALRVAYACKGPEKLILVTDAHANAGTNLTHFVMQGRPISVENGVCVGTDGTIAGSCLSMEGAFANARRFLNAGEEEAVRLTSTNAAEFLGLSAERGRIVAGLRADLVLLDAAGKVSKRWLAGVCV